MGEVNGPVSNGGKRCAHCGKCKPLGQFYNNAKSRDGKGSWCRTCMRIDCAARRATPAYAAWLAAYLARPDVRERRLEYDRSRSRSAAGRERARAYRRTLLGRLSHARSSAVCRLRLATEPGHRALLESRLAQLDAEIARVRATKEDGVS